MSRSLGPFYKKLNKYVDSKVKNRLPDIEITDQEKKKCSIKSDEYTKFYNLYCKEAYESIENDTPLRVVQLPKETMPFIVKFNLRFKDFTTRENLLSDLGIAAITQAIQDYLGNTFVFDAVNNFDACIVLMSDVLHMEYGHANYSSFSVQFHFPMCRVDRKKLQTKYSVELTSLLQKAWPGGEGVFEVKPVAVTWEKMLDARLYRKGVPLYGSILEQDDAFLKYFQAYDTLDQVDQNYNYSIQYLDDSSFDPQQHTKVAQEKISGEIFSSEHDDKEWYWLPLILSLDFWANLTPEIEKGKKIREERDKRQKTYDIQELMKKHTDICVEKKKTQDNFNKFISMWDIDRILNRHSANLIGEALYDLHKGESTGLSTWIAIMRSAMQDSRNKQHYFTPKNIRKLCDEAYNTFTRHRIDIETVEWYASIDSPERYDDWQEEWSSRTKVDALSGIEGDVSKDFKREFPLRYKCVHNGAKAMWYVYSNHRYRVDYGGLSIKKCMSTQYLLKIAKMRSDVSKQLEKEVSKEVGDLIMDKINKLIVLLKKQMFKNKLLSALEEEYKSRHFADHLDQNPEVLGTPNGVIAATDTDIKFREGKPQDYVTKCCKVMYRKDLSWDHPIVDAAILWAKMTFIDPETIDYFWKFMASILRGRNNDKKLMIWSGKRGNNGKSMWVRALSCVLGDYFTKIPMNLFTQGRGKANDASAVEASANGCRVVVAEEPEDSVPLLSSIIKSETGDDDKIVRGLYKDPRQQLPMYKFIVVCNTVPIMSAEEAMEERVVVHPFESRWGNRAPKTMEEQFATREFKIDPFFNKKIPSIAPGILWIMYNYYPKYIKYGIRKRPQAVEDITKKYWDANDRYLKFVEENVEVGKKGDRIEASEMFNRFSRWHFTSYRKLDVPDKYKALEALEKKKELGPMIAGGWSGVKLRERVQG